MQPYPYVLLLYGKNLPLMQQYLEYLLVLHLVFAGCSSSEVHRKRAGTSLLQGLCSVLCWDLW